MHLLSAFFDVLKNQENVIEQTKKIIKQYDVVNNPSHYTDSKIEVIDYIEDKNLGFCLGNVIKYVSRAGKKVDSDKSVIEKEIEDLKKARWYLDRRIYELEREQSNVQEKDEINSDADEFVYYGVWKCHIYNASGITIHEPWALEFQKESLTQIKIGIVKIYWRIK